MTDDLFSLYEHCLLCPRRCGADRLAGKAGFCGETAQLRAGRAALHLWEEPCLTGSTRASGAVFFTGCSLRCAYCQNGVLSRGKAGVPLSADDLAACFLSLEEQGAANIDLVTPDHFLPHIVSAVKTARSRGLTLPVVWNCSGYEDPEVLTLLDGIVDIYLADFKYLDQDLARDFSAAPDYPEYAKAALAEMIRQTGSPVFAGTPEAGQNGTNPVCIGGKDDPGKETVPHERRLMRGVLVRHLVLPGHVRASIDVLTYLHETYGDRILLSIMAQYTPPADAVFPDHPELTRKLTKREYDRVVNAAIALGIENAYIQDLRTAKESFIPAFAGTGIPHADGPVSD